MTDTFGDAAFLKRLLSFPVFPDLRADECFSGIDRMTNGMGRAFHHRDRIQHFPRIGGKTTDRGALWFLAIDEVFRRDRTLRQSGIHVRREWIVSTANRVLRERILRHYPPTLVAPRPASRSASPAGTRNMRPSGARIWTNCSAPAAPCGARDRNAPTS